MQHAQDIINRATTKVPICHPNDSADKIFALLGMQKWDSIQEVYVLDENHRLKGVIDLASEANIADETLAREIMKPPRVTLTPNADQEKAVIAAIKDDVVAIPVVHPDGTFKGAITANIIIDIMHDEHLEDALVSAGIRDGKNDGVFSRLNDGLSTLIASRAPWLIIGTGAGLILGLVSSLFEESLQRSIAIAYFIPVVAYVAGSVGAQSSTIAIRLMANVKLNYGTYLRREATAGVFLGVIVGSLGAVGAFLVSRELNVALAVGISLVFASFLATTLAAFIPFMLKAFGKDPALGSGPIATATLDIISVIIYFCIASVLVI